MEPWKPDTPVTLKRKLSYWMVSRLFAYQGPFLPMKKWTQNNCLDIFGPSFSSYQSFKSWHEACFLGLSTPKNILARNEVEKFATLHTFSVVQQHGIYILQIYAIAPFRLVFQAKGNNFGLLRGMEKLMFCRQNRTWNCAILLALPEANFRMSSKSFLK